MRQYVPLAERFWSKVDRRGENECWEWTAYRLRDGYGWFRVMDKNHGAHRVSYALTSGAIPKGMQIDHKCSNRACVNPAHLRLALHSENARNRTMNKGNRTGFKGVTKDKNRFKAEIQHNGVRHYLGLWPTPEEAHAAYVRAANELHGHFAHT